MTFAVSATLRSLLAARLDMSVPSLKGCIAHYTPETAASLLPYEL
jgi:hypothetical protein